MLVLLFTLALDTVKALASTRKGYSSIIMGHRFYVGNFVTVFDYGWHTCMCNLSVCFINVNKLYELLYKRVLDLSNISKSKLSNFLPEGNM